MSFALDIQKFAKKAGDNADKVVKDVMQAIKAHEDMMEKGQKLLDDPEFDDTFKELVKEQMKTSQLCMEALGLL